MATGGQRTGNLPIICLGKDSMDTNQISTGQPDKKSSIILIKSDSLEDEAKTNSLQFIIEGHNAKKLRFFYTEKLNDIKTYPSVKITEVTEKQNGIDVPDVCVEFPQSRKEHFENWKKEVQTLIDDIVEEKVNFKNEEDVENAIKKFKKSKMFTEILLIPLDVGKVCVCSLNRKKLQKAVEHLEEIKGENERMSKPVVSSRAGRKFDEGVKSHSRYGRQESTDSNNSDSDSYQGFSSSDIRFQFQTSEGLLVKLYKGSITNLRVDAIVNAANEKLNNGGGVAYAISKAAGRALEDGCKEYIFTFGKIGVSDNCVTVSGKLPCSSVIHAVGPAWHDYKDKRRCLEDLSDTVLNILETSQRKKYKEVAMPPISSGIFAVPKPFCAAMYLRGILEFSKRHPTDKKVKEFHIIDIKEEMLDLVEKAYEKWKRDPNCIDPARLLEGTKYENHWSSKSCSQFGHSVSSGYKTQNESRKSDMAMNHGHGYGTKMADHNYVCRSKEIYEDKDKGLTIFEFKGKLEVHIYSKNLVTLQDVDIIVSTENRMLSGQGELAKTLLKTAGDKYVKEHKALLSGHNSLPFGSVLMTKASKLPFKRIFHVIVEKFPGHIVPRPFDLKQQEEAVRNVLEKANLLPALNKKKKKLTKIAMTLFGSGNLTTPLYIEKHCGSVYDAVAEFAEQHYREKTLRLEEIHFVNMRAEITKAFIEVFRARSTEPPIERSPERHSWHSTSPGSVDKSKGGPSYNAVHGYNTFDPRKFKIIDTWKMEQPKSIKTELMKYIEPVNNKPSNLLQNLGSSAVSRKDGKGNLSIYSSSGDESKPLKTEVNTKTTKVDACVGCEKKKDKKDKKELLDCGHYLCVVCFPGYGNSCPICTFKESVVRSKGPTSLIDAKVEVSEDCIICMDVMNEPVQFKQCKHSFCKECITEFFNMKPICPVCNTVYGIMYGTQPTSGKATVYKDSAPLPGYKGCGTLIISYEFEDGTQENCHPNPGTKYKGLKRQGYLPDNREGREVLDLLKVAFKQGLTFTIGRSRTTGQENVLTWNDIHHKTRREGGPERFGYPDEEYLGRVMDELEAKGISCERNWDDF